MRCRRTNASGVSGRICRLPHACKAALGMGAAQTGHQRACIESYEVGRALRRQQIGREIVLVEAPDVPSAMTVNAAGGVFACAVAMLGAPLATITSAAMAASRNRLGSMGLSGPGRGAGLA